MIAKLFMFLLVALVLFVFFFVVMPILLTFAVKGLYKREKELRVQEKLKKEYEKEKNQKKETEPKFTETNKQDRFTQARSDLNRIIQEEGTPENIKLMALNLLEEIEKTSKKSQDKKEAEALIIFKTIEQMLQKNHQNT